MRFAGVGLGSTLVALGCGGILVDDAGVKATLQAIEAVAADHVVVTFVEGGTQAGLAGPLCGSCLSALVHVDRADWGPIGARIQVDPSCACPTTCLAEILARPPDDPLAAADVACAADDVLFTGPLAPLRAVSPVVEQGIVRVLIRDLDTADLDAARETLAVGLAALGDPSLEPTDEPVVEGASTDLLLDRLPDLRGCDADVAHRLLVAPDGLVRAVVGANECVSATLGDVDQGAAEAWRVVDLTWSAAGIRARGDAGGGDVPDAPRPPRPGAARPGAGSRDPGSGEEGPADGGGSARQDGGEPRVAARVRRDPRLLRGGSGARSRSLRVGDGHPADRWRRDGRVGERLFRNGRRPVGLRGRSAPPAAVPGARGWPSGDVVAAPGVRAGVSGQRRRRRARTGSSRASHPGTRAPPSHRQPPS